MQKHVLALTTSAFILVCGVITASAQQGPMMQQQPQLQQQEQERHHNWRGGTMGPGMMGQGGMMGRGMMGRGMMGGGMVGVPVSHDADNFQSYGRRW